MKNLILRLTANTHKIYLAEIHLEALMKYREICLSNFEDAMANNDYLTAFEQSEEITRVEAKTDSAIHKIRLLGIVRREIMFDLTRDLGG